MRNKFRHYQETEQTFLREIWLTDILIDQNCSK